MASEAQEILALTLIFVVHVGGRRHARAGAARRRHDGPAARWWRRRRRRSAALGPRTDAPVRVAGAAAARLVSPARAPARARRCATATRARRAGRRSPQPSRSPRAAARRCGAPARGVRSAARAAVPRDDPSSTPSAALPAAHGAPSSRATVSRRRERRARRAAGAGAAPARRRRSTRGPALRDRLVRTARDRAERARTQSPLAEPAGAIAALHDGAHALTRAPSTRREHGVCNRAARPVARRLGPAKSSRRAADAARGAPSSDVADVHLGDLHLEAQGGERAHRAVERRLVRSRDCARGACRPMPSSGHAARLEVAEASRHEALELAARRLDGVAR